MKLSKSFTQQILVTICSLGLMACGDDKNTYLTSDVTGLSSLDKYAIQILPANSMECSNGGQTYLVYLDDNQNRTVDEGEEILSTASICNGTNGTNAYSTLFSMSRVESDTCAVGTGVQINSGLDVSRNFVLEFSEINQSQVLCDGQNGVDGANGKDGKSLVFTVADSSANVCPAGGKIIVMASDENNNNIYDDEDSNHQSLTLCNGTNAILPAYTPVAPIFPCGNTTNFEEVLLRLKNGQVLASLSNNTAGQMTRLALIPDGNYMTTDNTNCKFSLSTSGQTRSVSWSNQIQESWAISY